MPVPQDKVKSLFLSALEIESAEAREAFLAEQCGNDQQLQGQVLSLLDHEQQLNSFLEPDTAMPTLAMNDNQPSEKIGSYVIREKIGEGGMGVVYVAEQTQPIRRKVALKVIKPALANREATARFEAERQALAMMDHPHIARVYDGGATESGQPYFVMELVQGLSITEFCDRKRSTTRQRIELFLHVCRAVQHAHQRGIIHRDIKPSNVLVPEIDGAAVPKVIDFGVAKAVHQKLTDRTVYTQFSQMVGTPLYMSPEQADLGVVDVDTRTDVFSLGVLLYELLTGNTPLDRERVSRATMDEVRRILRDEEPRRPSVLVSTLKADALSTVAGNRDLQPHSLSESLRGELDWIVMKALEKDRNRRYETPASLADDLQRYLDDRPVEARPPSRAYLVKKFARRHRLAVGFATAIAMTLLLGLIGTTTGMAWAVAAKATAQSATEDAVAAAHRSQRLLYVARIRLAHQHLLADRPVDALAQLKLCPEESRDWEWNYLERACHAKKEISVSTDNWVYAIHPHPKQDDLLVELRDRGVTQIADLGTDPPQTRETALSIGGSDHDGIDLAGRIGYLPNGELLAISSDQRAISLVDKEFERKAVVVSESTETIQRFVLNRQGDHLAFRTSDGNVKVWDIQRRREIARVVGGDWNMCLDADADYLAVSSFGDSFEVWDLQANKKHFLGSIHTGPVVSMCFHREGEYLATASFDSTIAIWNVQTGDLEQRWRGGHSNLYSITFNPSGTRLASTGEDGTIRVWDWRAEDEKELMRLRGTKGKEFEVSFSFDGNKLLSGGTGSTLSVFDGTPWSADAAREPLILSGMKSHVQALDVHPSGTEVAAAGEGGVVRTWDLHTGDVKRVFTKHGVGRAVWEIKYSPDGQFIISTGASEVPPKLSTIRWHPPSAQLGENGFQVSYDNPSLALDIHPDGEQYVQGSDNGQLTAHDARTGELIGVFGNHTSQVQSICYSPDRRFVVSRAEDGSVVRWDANLLHQRQEGIRLLDESEGRIAMINDGRSIVAGQNDGLVVVNIDTLEAKSIPAHGAPVSECAFHERLRLIASASLDGTVKLWNADSLALVDTVIADGALFRVAFSPDGQRLIAVGEEPNVKIWNIEAFHLERPKGPAAATR